MDIIVLHKTAKILVTQAMIDRETDKKLNLCPSIGRE